jgi:membrane protein
MMQMLTIEHAFNGIWQVRETRPLVRRLILHVLTLLLGPILFGGSIAIITFLASVSFGLFAESYWIDAAFFRSLSFAFTSVLFALLYWAVPAKPVRVTHALVGGIFAAGGFTFLQRLFSTYIANFPAYTIIYGAFAVLPIFLLWLYLSWSVILVGALIVAELPRPMVPRKIRQVRRAK